MANNWQLKRGVSIDQSHQQRYSWGLSVIFSAVLTIHKLMHDLDTRQIDGTFIYDLVNSVGGIWMFHCSRLVTAYQYIAFHCSLPQTLVMRLCGQILYFGLVGMGIFSHLAAEGIWHASKVTFFIGQFWCRRPNACVWSAPLVWKCMVCLVSELMGVVNQTDLFCAIFVIFGWTETWKESAHTAL